MWYKVASNCCMQMSVWMY